MIERCLGTTEAVSLILTLGTNVWWATLMYGSYGQEIKILKYTDGFVLPYNGNVYQVVEMTAARGEK